jgi:5-methylthioribose kinase
MEKFTSYFTMNEADAIEYARTRLEFFEPDAELSCSEIGDGNLTYVFRIADGKTGRSIIIKQAGPVARISDEFRVSPDRNRIESEILTLQYELAPGLVPKVFRYDPVMNCCAMEDLSDHTIMRKALLEHRQFPLFADHITTFMVNTLLLTSDVVMNHKAKKERMKRFVNPDLCEITEDLVYTEPFYDCPRNDVFEPTRPFARKLLWEDETLRLETAKLKFDFMTRAQSLVHGDLHTGSIFVRPDSTKVIDPEFAFYGPAGYDVGNVLANLIFAYVNARQTMKEGSAKDLHIGWVRKTIEEVADLFQSKFLAAFREHATEPTARIPGFDRFYLGGIMSDASAVTGLELCRRTLGLAHVKDLTSIADPEKRAEAERICLIAGKTFIMERDRIQTGRDYIRTLDDSVAAAAAN